MLLGMWEGSRWFGFWCNNVWSKSVHHPTSRVCPSISLQSCLSIRQLAFKPSSILFCFFSHSTKLFSHVSPAQRHYITPSTPPLPRNSIKEQKCPSPFAPHHSLPHPATSTAPTGTISPITTGVLSSQPPFSYGSAPSEPKDNV